MTFQAPFRNDGLNKILSVSLCVVSCCSIALVFVADQNLCQNYLCTVYALVLSFTEVNKSKTMNAAFTEKATYIRNYQV